MHAVHAHVVADDELVVIVAGDDVVAVAIVVEVVVRQGCRAGFTISGDVARRDTDCGWAGWFQLL